MKRVKKLLVTLLAVTLLLNGNTVVSAEEVNPFADVKTTDWFYPYVSFVVDNNLMVGKGTSDEKIVFDPVSTMTRAEFVQVLYNMEGKPKVEYTDIFSDIPNPQEDKNAWYSNAVIWAAEMGITSGKPDGSFGKTENITREQMAQMLMKYAKSKEFDISGNADLTSFKDSENISKWAVPAMQWAVDKGIMSGTANKELKPQGSATRAEAATMLEGLVEAYQIVMKKINLFADKDTLLVGEADSALTFYVESNVVLNEVVLYEASCPDEPVAYLYDGGDVNKGDDMAGDGIYSAIYGDIPLEENTWKFYAVCDGFKSNTVSIQCYVSDSEEVMESIAEADSDIRDLTASQEFMDMSVEERKAVAYELVDELIETSAIDEESVNFSEDSGMISYQYADGTLGGILVEDFGTEINGVNRDGSIFEVPGDLEVYKEVGDTVEEYAQKVLILNSFPSFETEQARIEYRTTFYENLKDEWNNKGISVELDTEVTVSDYRNLDDYEVVVIATHGSTYTWNDGFLWLNHHEAPAICLSEESTKAKDKQLSVERKAKQIVKVNGCYWILPSFFENAYSSNELDGTFVYSECCLSMGGGGKVDNSMANAFISRSAEAYVGFHNSVLADYSRGIMKEYVSELFKGYTSEEAFQTAVNAYASNHEEWYEASRGKGSFKTLVETPRISGGWGEVYDAAWHVAYPILSGDKNAKLIDTTLVNGNFEATSVDDGIIIPTAWTAQGDVRSISQLGDAVPVGANSKRMAIITTGVGSKTTATIGEGTEGSYISQRFLVPDTATKLSFDYNFVSEEPEEYVGSIFDDSFNVRLVSDGTIVYEEMYESINTSTWVEIGNVDFAEGDSTIFQTEWKHAEIDITDYQGEVITLYYIICDVGDSLYDSACLLDNVVVE